LITLHAGEGHQNEWRIDPDELRALSPLVVAPPSGEVARMQEAVNRAAPSPAPPAPAQPEALPVARSVAPQAAGHLNPPQAAGALNPSQAPLDTAELEAMMGRVLDAKLAPIRRALAERDDGPNLRDILGGIGWIFGLLGVAALMKFRKP
jgi:nickel transport protein